MIKNITYPLQIMATGTKIFVVKRNIIAKNLNFLILNTFLFTISCVIIKLTFVNVVSNSDECKP